MTSDISVAWQDWETVSAASQKTHNSEVQPWKTTKNPAKSPSQAVLPLKQPLFSLGCLQVLCYHCRADPGAGLLPWILCRARSPGWWPGLVQSLSLLGWSAETETSKYKTKLLCVEPLMMLLFINREPSNMHVEVVSGFLLTCWSTECTLSSYYMLLSFHCHLLSLFWSLSLTLQILLEFS